MSEAETKAVVTTPSDREIRAERIIKAPRDKVFEAYTDPKLIPQWWGPRKVETRVDKMEARTGGDWQFTQVAEDGSENVFRGAFRDITPPERIVQTFEWLGMPGYVAVDSVVFEDLGDGRTKIVSTSLFFTTEERDGMLQSGMEGGMNETLDRLEELLASG